MKPKAFWPVTPESDLCPSGAYFGQRFPEPHIRAIAVLRDGHQGWRLADAYGRILSGCHVTFQRPIPSYNL